MMFLLEFVATVAANARINNLREVLKKHFIFVKKSQIRETHNMEKMGLFLPHPPIFWRFTTNMIF